jgi:hypothetical protein
MGEDVFNEEMSNNYDNLHAKIPQGASKILWENTLLDY